MSGLQSCHLPFITVNIITQRNHTSTPHNFRKIKKGRHAVALWSKKRKTLILYPCSTVLIKNTNRGTKLSQTLHNGTIIGPIKQYYNHGVFLKKLKRMLIAHKNIHLYCSTPNLEESNEKDKMDMIHRRIRLLS